MADEKEQWDSGVDRLWAVLDQMSDAAVRQTTRTVAEYRRQLVDKLLASLVYQQLDGSEVLDPSHLTTYIQEMDELLAGWSSTVGQGSVASAAELGASGYSGLLEKIAGVTRPSVLGLTEDLAVAASSYRVQGFKSLSADVATLVADEVRGVVFGTQSRWDAVKNIRAALADGKSPGKFTQRAITLERTALMSVFNAAGARALTAAESEIPGLMKEWSAAHQKQTCDRCRGLDGKRVRPRDQFDRGLFAPPAHPRCRCRTVAWVPGWG